MGSAPWIADRLANRRHPGSAAFFCRLLAFSNQLKSFLIIEKLPDYPPADVHPCFWISTYRSVIARGFPQEIGNHSRSVERQSQAFLGMD